MEPRYGSGFVGKLAVVLCLSCCVDDGPELWSWLHTDRHQMLSAQDAWYRAVGRNLSAASYPVPGWRLRYGVLLLALRRGAVCPAATSNIGFVHECPLFQSRRLQAARKAP